MILGIVPDTTPDCVTVCVCPAIVTFPVRVLAAVLAPIESRTGPFPEPLAPAVMVIQETALDAVQAHPGDAITTTDFAPPVALTLVLADQRVYVHPPACVTVCVCPAIVSVPVRNEEDVLAATE